MATPTDILFPVGRLVGGSVFKANDTDNGKPRVYTDGPNKGQPRVTFDFAVAIPKTPGHTHWAQTEWGAKIYAIGQAAHPQMCQSPMFAWKIRDGDSTVPNLRGNKPCDQEGHPGHWVLWFSSGFAPKTLRDNGTAPMPNTEVKTGHYVQVYGSCAGNTGQKPGVYLNHSIVNWAAFGPEIVSGPDPTTVGFGQGVVLPAGASMTPPAGSFTPGAGSAPPPAFQPPAPAFTPPPQLVAPNPGFLPPGAATPPPPGAVLPPPPAGPQLTPAGIASGFTYEQYRSGGWTDDVMRAKGLLA